MRIGIDCRLPTYQMGGISQYILHLLPALAKVDENSEYLLFHSRKENRSFIPPEGGGRFARRNLWTPCHHRWERWTLTMELARHQLDVLHSPDFIPPQGGGKRRVITIHDLNFALYPEFLTAESRRYYLDQVQWATEVADHISVDSDATRTDVIELLRTPEEKVTTIHLAANPLYECSFADEEVESTLKKYNLPRGYILFVGTLEPRKNLPMLIRVYSRLRRDVGFDLPLLLVGSEGWMTEAIYSTIADLELDRFVHHLPGVIDVELAHLYHAAGALATPSQYEGFGLPALEAQHCGCPVIVSNRGSLPEIVGENGLALDPDDNEIWAESLERVLIDSELRETMIRNGRVQARKFSWKKTARETVALYRGK